MTSIREILSSGHSFVNIVSAISNKTKIPSSTVENIIQGHHFDKDKIIKRLNQITPHEWAVAAVERGYYIVEIYTGKTKFIGEVKGTGTNNYDKARKEAEKRNLKYGITSIPKYLSARTEHEIQNEIQKYNPNYLKGW
jgi:hypothetical protein